MQFKQSANNEGTEFISYSLSNGIDVTYYFNQSVCTKYFLELPSTYKDDAATSLTHLYSPIADDGKSGNLAYDGIWVDRVNNMRWTLEIRSDAVLIREKQNPQ